LTFTAARSYALGAVTIEVSQIDKKLRRPPRKLGYKSKINPIWIRRQALNSLDAQRDPPLRSQHDRVTGRLPIASGLSFDFNPRAACAHLLGEE
jgi:hypothetical protein